MRRGGGIHWNCYAKESSLGSPFELLILLDSVSNAERAVQGRITSVSERGARSEWREGEAEGKKARGQKELSEIKNGHGDEGRHFTILPGIIRVYFFCSSRPPIISASSFLPS